IDFDSLSYAFFQNENNDSQLRLLRANDNRRISLKKNWRNCAVDVASSWFIGCEGVTKGISNKAFNIWQGKDRKYHLKVTSNPSYTDILKGKIIKITIHCTKPNRFRKMLFKFEGALNCSISVPNLQPSVPTTMTTAIEEATASSSSSSSSLLSSSSSSSRPSPSSTSFSSSFSAPLPFSSLLSPSSTTTKTTASRSNTLPLNSSSSSKTSQIRIAHKPDGDDLYNELTLEGPPALYASTYDIPNPLYRDETLSRGENQTQPGIDDHFYAPLNFQQGCNIYGLGSNQDTNDSIYQNYGAFSIEQPIYSLLEELTTVQPMKKPTQESSEPVYNVPDEPDQELSGNPNHFDSIFPEQPVYNTLESPFGSGEDPECINEPIYNVLEE
ncbi:unnamed protein product, partial [Porites lobata]